MIGCAEAVKRLWEYLDATIDLDDRVLVEEHLTRCRTCCGELEFAKELRRILAERSPADLPADVIQRLNHTVEELGT
ncbi:MAG TPA: zf-HC2 domain-containing protein [Nocardioidaceae bacterium]|jgi:predicted anti-sigma-YlaC factor YlaD|nr:zf-HC2 domain-containing protein [Nocardioidaceae bacterium]